ncbi:UNVERIFIED_CONTAM: putative late blight resistance proteinR1B-16 [Sesamum radiatum]|uniref:Late blight resistance proteinR1B-16 n=1 Tax=Sesamum radiatum TaxID=300843 RepID=A0AAW2RYZ9_SESRA
MAAYTALLSLSQVLNNLQPHDRRRFFHNKDDLLRSLHEKVDFLQDFLENFPSHKASNLAATESLETRIRAAAYAAEDIIESHMSYHLDPFRKMCLRVLRAFSVAVHVLWTPDVHPSVVSVVAKSFSARRNHKWVQVIKEMEFIIKEVVKIKNACAGEDLRKNRNILPASTKASSRLHLGMRGENLVVGFEGDLAEIRSRMVGASSNLEIVSIVGMGGIGKTTLAKQVYDDSYIIYQFDIRAWVVVSQEYSLRRVLVGLLDSAKLLNTDMQDKEVEELAVYLYQSLKGRRYIIVMDDLWDIEIWDDVRRLFPDDGNGSRVLLTTRISDVAEYANSCSSYHMRFLNEEDSWNLLCRKVFEEGACPLELEEIGKEIARKCGGHPLSIVVIGGLLSKTSTTQEYWRSVANNLNAVVTEDDDRCLEILALSYNHLPHHLRACFLYMGVFPEDHDIRVSQLIRLWAAEGFLKPNTSKMMEDVAEGYLKDLVERSLVLVGKKSSRGKIKSCKLHDLLRALCVKNAQKENLFHVFRYYDAAKQDTSACRRLSIHPDDRQPQEIYNSIHSIPHIRSLLFLGGHFIYPWFVYFGFRLLRVLDISAIPFHELPVQVTELVNLRYLGFTCVCQLPPSISKLQNLETLVYFKWSLDQLPLLPREIWVMPKLRHLSVLPSWFLDHAQHLPNNTFRLENLQTLSEVRNFRCSSDIIERIPNLRRLKILYDVSLFESCSSYQLENLATLHKLETLTLRIEFPLSIPEVVYPGKLAFPLQLRKLTLRGLNLPWCNMTIIGSLPNLEVLKLLGNAFRGPEWRSIEGEFCQLKFLQLECCDVVQWRADDTHFPRLQNLTIRSCYKLEEIPSCIGDISTLQLIELDSCSPSAMTSAKQIQEEQQFLGNYDLQVLFSPGLKF